MVEAFAVIGFLRNPDSGIEMRLVNPVWKRYPFFEMNVSILSSLYKLAESSVLGSQMCPFLEDGIGIGKG